MARKSQPEGKKYSYMDTYGDLVTLLLCFFVLLFSMSTVDQVKYNAIVEAFGDRFGNNPLNLTTVTSSIPTTTSEFAERPPVGEAMDPNQVLPADFNQLAEAIQKHVEENNMQASVEVTEGANNVVYIRLYNNLLFRADSYELLPASLPVMGFLGECFMAVEDEILRVNCIGHTAAVEGSGVDDWILSGERAGAVVSYFENESGFPMFKLVGTDYGRTYPIADNSDPMARAANRRVDIIVTGNNKDTLQAAMADAMRVYFPGDDTQYFEGDPADLPGGALDEIPPVGEADMSLPIPADSLPADDTQAPQDAGQSGAGQETPGQVDTGQTGSGQAPA